MTLAYSLTIIKPGLWPSSKLLFGDKSILQSQADGHLAHCNRPLSLVSLWRSPPTDVELHQTCWLTRTASQTKLRDGGSAKLNSKHSFRNPLHLLPVKCGPETTVIGKSNLVLGMLLRQLCLNMISSTILLLYKYIDIFIFKKLTSHTLHNRDTHSINKTTTKR